MWPIFWILTLSSILLPAAPPPADLGRLPPESVGPRSEQEARILWESAQTAWANKKYTDTIYSLKRLTARYPADPHFTEAHFLMGQAHQEIGQHDDAIKALRFYAQAIPQSPSAWLAQLKLAESYLVQKKYHLAFALGSEVFKKSRHRGDAHDFATHALLTEAQAQMYLKNKIKAQALWDSAQERIELQYPDHQLPADLGGHSQNVKMMIELGQCHSFVIRNQTLNEGQARDLLKRRALCMASAGTALKKVLETQNNHWIALSSQQYLDSVGSFREECTQLPRAPGHRSKAQISKFNKEIQEILRLDCKQHQAELVALFKSSPEASPRPEQNQLEEIFKALERDLPL